MDWLTVNLNFHQFDLLLNQNLFLLVKGQLLRSVTRHRSKQILEVFPECPKLFENWSGQCFSEGVEVLFEGKQAVRDGSQSADRLQDQLFVVAQTIPVPPLLLH